MHQTSNFIVGKHPKRPVLAPNRRAAPRLNKNSGAPYQVLQQLDDTVQYNTTRYESYLDSAHRLWPSALPSLAPSRIACIRYAIGPRSCHLETQLDFETLAGDASISLFLSNVAKKESAPPPSKRRLGANWAAPVPRQNRSWPIASPSWRAAAEKRRAPVQGESRPVSAASIRT